MRTRIYPQSVSALGLVALCLGLGTGLWAGERPQQYAQAGNEDGAWEETTGQSGSGWEDFGAAGTLVRHPAGPRRGRPGGRHWGHPGGRPWGHPGGPPPQDDGEAPADPLAHGPWPLLGLSAEKEDRVRALIRAEREKVEPLCRELSELRESTRRAIAAQVPERKQGESQPQGSLPEVGETKLTPAQKRALEAILSKARRRREELHGKMRAAHEATRSAVDKLLSLSERLKLEEAGAALGPPPLCGPEAACGPVGAQLQSPPPFGPPLHGYGFGPGGQPPMEQPPLGQPPRGQGWGAPLPPPRPRGQKEIAPADGEAVAAPQWRALDVPV